MFDNHHYHGEIPPFRFWVQQNLPALYEDSLSYLELASRLNWYIENIIKTLQVYDDKFCEIFDLYRKLKCYIDEYLDAIDFPDLVKEIMDDMVDNGVIGDLLEQHFTEYNERITVLENKPHIVSIENHTIIVR